MNDDALHELLREQEGVVSRRQVLACGGDDDLIERRVRRREWARVHPGVFVDHTGPLSWSQRAWGRCPPLLACRALPRVSAAGAPL